MSFSSEVKQELLKQYSKARHCQLAELAAIVAMEGHIDENGSLYIYTDNSAVVEKYTMLIKKLFQLDVTRALTKEVTEKILTALKLTENLAIASLLESEYSLQGVAVNGLLLQNTCCKRAFLRGVFLASGSISDPRKSYHFEIVCHTKAQAEQIKEILEFFEGEPKIVRRNQRYVLYLKEGSQIVDSLNVMEAYVSLMNLENIRIEKEMRNSINRQVNCETANINKTVTAAVRQIQDIELIRDTGGLERLPENLYEMAVCRLENPDTPLKDLGQLLDPPVGKSGVNHRLRKLSQLADQLRLGEQI
ncbi:MAG: DNA-binding protein WhiA [Agathobacter sp.]|nr:DNA-binding protein WhiA [Agathobacter sp.]MDY3888480.1 DNA-binding protein WhiA [Agathobacter sp.]